MHARVTFIEAAAESVASLEDADAPFATDAPFLSFAEPALLLALSPLRTASPQIGNRHLCDSQLLRSRFVGGGEKASVAGSHARDHAEPLLMLFDGRDQQGRVRRPFVIHLVGDDDLVFRFLNFDHLAELGGFARFSFADDFGGVFKQNDDLASRVGDALDDLFRLSWKWRERCSVKITERTREKDKEAIHSRRESRHLEAAFVEPRADLQALRSTGPSANGLLP